MRLPERLKRWFGIPRSFESVAADLADGLRNGTITLGRPEETEPIPSEGAISSVPTSTNGSVAHPTEPAPSPPSSH